MGFRRNTAGVFVLLALAAGCSGGDKYNAEDNCKKAVAKSLKSPATAKFANLTTNGGSGPWDTAGDVDSENSFGALIRSHFTCHTTLDGDKYRSRLTTFSDGGGN